MFKGITTRLALAAGLSAFAMGPALAQAPAGQAEDWAAVEAAAKKEGTLTLYSNLLPNGIEPILSAFRADYPEIKTESVRLGDNPLIERFSTELNFNRNMADVVITFPDDRLWKGLEAGWALQWAPPELPNFPKEVSFNNKAFTLQYARVAIIWNKNLVKPEDEPKEWTDLFDPKWKGKLGFNPVWRALTKQQLVAFWEDKIGITDVAEKLKAQDVRFFEGSGGVSQAVLRGDVQIAPLDDLPLNPFLEDGAPLGFVYPESGTPISTNLGFVSAKAPHPAAAKVFLNWLMTKKGQETLQKNAGLTVSRSDVAAPKFIPATKDLKNAVRGQDFITPERSKKMVEHWQKLFGVR
jgi:iron(III) transport system substrate-binding protein